jgi:hypothetical protein
VTSLGNSWLDGRLLRHVGNAGGGADRHYFFRDAKAMLVQGKWSLGRQERGRLIERSV